MAHKKVNVSTKVKAKEILFRDIFINKGGEEKVLSLSSLLRTSLLSLSTWDSVPICPQLISKIVSLSFSVLAIFEQHCNASLDHTHKLSILYLQTRRQESQELGIYRQ